MGVLTTNAYPHNGLGFSDQWRRVIFGKISDERRSENSRVIIRIRSSQDTDSKLVETGMRGVGRDITGGKKLREEKDKVIDELYRQIDQLKVENEWLKKICTV
ncbi:MAG: hypothetical protein NG784_15195 [Candidatus Jettenia sp.]|nr:hypothetical protein [Candidatus Jettenia sp.]